jgi:hypothetical protein
LPMPFPTPDPEPARRGHGQVCRPCCAQSMSGMRHHVSSMPEMVMMVMMVVMVVCASSTRTNSQGNERRHDQIRFNDTL